MQHIWKAQNWSQKSQMTGSWALLVRRDEDLRQDKRSENERTWVCKSFRSGVDQIFLSGARQ